MTIFIHEMLKKIIIIFSVLYYVNAQSQIQINTTGNLNDPAYLIDNVLIGNGITTSNHSFTGDSSQIGYFTDSLGLSGMTEGFILSTGGVDSVGNLGGDTLFWDYIYDSTFTNIIDSTPFVDNYHLTTMFSNPGDPDLLTIANSVPGLIGQSFSVSSTADAAILEFDFIPSSDTVKFNYVFASEEYLTFVNSDFNDVFAFLISGPGITGPYASPAGFPGGAKNIATIPNSNPILPITISTVNDVLNSQYYNHDSLGSVSAFNGYTNVFTAKSAVIPCNVYHIKLAIADGTDGSYDSGVFFEAGSFDAVEPGALSVNVITTDLLCYGDTNGSATLCVSGGVAPYVINWNGVNPNNLTGGTYNVSVTDAQGSSGSTIFTINSPSQLSAFITQQNIDLHSNVSGGIPGYTYNWHLNGTSISNTPIYTPIQNGDYTLLVTDSNGCSVMSETFSVSNIATGIASESNEKITIYPNPFNNKTTIYIPSDIQKRVQYINLVSIDGRLVKNIIADSKNIVLTKESLDSGIYLLMIKHGL